MKVRVIYNQDKSIAVIHPAPKSRQKDEIEEIWLNRVFDKATPANASYEDIDESELPQSREDRNAWEGEKGKGIKVNKTKAKQIKAEQQKKWLIREEMERLAEESLKEKGLI